MIADSEKAGEVHESNFCLQWNFDGKPVHMLVDTGCTHTLVRSDLLRPHKIDSLSRVKVRCCHGDVKSYPTATVKLDVRGVEHCVVAGVWAQLPQPVLLGHDIDACLVLTLGGWQEDQENSQTEAVSHAVEFV